MARDQVGVRELRENASEVVRRASEGETIDITDRGRLVARMVPAHLRGMEALRSAGLVREATRSVADLPPPLPTRPGERTLGDILAEQREDER